MWDIISRALNSSGHWGEMTLELDGHQAKGEWEMGDGRRASSAARMQDSGMVMTDKALHCVHWFYSLVSSGE